MALPWKKVKSTRISRLVNDHLHISQKRRDGSSLVVETGFPTSLIDLFFKNREKLKKPPRKRRPVASPDDVLIDGSPISCASPPPPPPPSLAGSPPPRSHSSPSLARSPPPEGHTSVLPPPPSRADEICAVGSGGVGAQYRVAMEESGGESDGDGNGEVNVVLIGVMKVFMVAVLALATKRLTLGITISAVLLLLLEYAGKHFPAAKAAATPVLRIAAKFSRQRKLEEKQEPSTKPVSFPLNTPASRSPIREIQPLESPAAEEIQPANESISQEIELVEMAMKREESISNSIECKKKSRKGKIKSKMQKIVPKKFRGTKKEQDLPIPKQENSIFTKEQGDHQCEEFENGSISSSMSECSEENDCKASVIRLDRRLSNVVEESETEIEEKRRKIGGAVSRRYMVLCLIVLAGLIGGRPFALALTLLWFLMLKLGQALPMTMIMSFNVKSG